MTEPKDFYSPGEIKFSRPQMIWIIENLESLSAGIYPPDCKVTGYTGKKRGGFSRHGYFENPCIIAAEVERRLKKTKTDGKLLKAEIQGGVTDYKDLEPESQMALNYISLFDFRKRPPYYQWKKRRRYYYSKEKRYQMVSKRKQEGRPR